MSTQTILAIDDLSESLDLYRSLIEKYIPDTECKTALDGPTGIQIAFDVLPDLILVDAKLPDMDGFEVVNQLRANAATANIPILMVSGVMTTRENRISGFASGADGYICKPFQSEEFIAEINVLLRIKGYEDQLRAHEQQLEEELQIRTGALIESEERFRTLFEQSPDAVFVESIERTVLDVNEAACKLHRMTRDELIGRAVTDLVPERIRDQVRADHKKLFGDNIQVIESFSLTRDGEEIPVEIRTKEISYNNKPAAILIVRDIRIRRKIETALQTVAKDVSPLTGFSFFYGLVQQLCKVLDVDFAGFALIKPEKPGYAETFALCGDGKVLENFEYELEGTPCEKVYDTDSCVIHEGAQNVYPRDEILREMGIEAYVGCPLFKSNGTPMGHMFVMNRSPLEESQLPISMLQIFGARAAAEYERIQATENLWESEERYRSLTDDVLDRSLVGLFILDKDSTIVWANQILDTYFQIDRNEIIGQNMEVLVTDTLSSRFSNPAAFTKAILSDLNTSRRGKPIELHIPPGVGIKERWLEYFSQPIRTGLYAGGRIEHFTDISRQKGLQEQLLQAQKMEGIGRLAGGVAHDFNNLLTSILGFSHLLLDDLDEASPLRPCVDEIIHAGLLAEKLTRQLLVFGRKQIMQVRPLDLNRIVTEMDKLLRRTLGEDVELTSVMEPNLPAVEADSGQVEQIIMNLAVNARDAMPLGGRIDIRTASRVLSEEDAEAHINASPGRYVSLSISDTGEGISEDIVRHVFEPFFTTKAHDKGTGLGLSIVYGIVEQFGGFIEIDSEKGVGTTISIVLPQSRSVEEAPVHRTLTELPRGDATILVVEDEETVRHLTVRILESLGYTLFTARDAEQALAIFDKEWESIDLILTDVVMPKMSGKELGEELERRGKPYKIIYTSGFTEDRIEDHGINAAAHHLILKPYTRESLATTVHNALNAPGKPPSTTG